MFNLSTQTAKVSAPYGLVSFFPQLGGFGEFRELDGNVSGKGSTVQVSSSNCDV